MTAEVRRPTTHVFLGPSLDRQLAGVLLPGAVLHPPVAHLDLLRLPVSAGDRVVLLDGVFQQCASVRHKEILDLLGRGVAVYGAASMGALRAAELGPFGMVGSGVVHRLYTLGILDADDEVALLHDSGEDGDWSPRTVALVSVRVLAAHLRRRNILSPTGRDALVSAARELHFTRRSWPGLLDAARRHGLDADAAVAVRAAARRPAPEWDVKSRDAAALLRRLARPEPVTVAPVDMPWAATGFLVRWRHPPDSPLSMRVTAAALWAVDFPMLYRRTVLNSIGADPVAVATDRGLVPDTDLDGLHHAYRAWLGPGERFVDRAALVTTVLVRSYQWAPAVPPLPLLHDALVATPAFPYLCRLVDEVQELNVALDKRGYPVERASVDSLHAFCAARWDTPDITPARFDRGFTTLDDLARRGRPLLAYSRFRLADRDLVLGGVTSDATV